MVALYGGPMSKFSRNQNAAAHASAAAAISWTKAIQTRLLNLTDMVNFAPQRPAPVDRPTIPAESGARGQEQQTAKIRSPAQSRQRQNDADRHPSAVGADGAA